MLHWRYELPCQDKLPEFHYTPIVGCIRVFWLVLHPLGLGLDKALFGWNSVTGPSNRDPGQWVANPSPIKQFTQAYTTAGRSLSSIRGNAPSTTDRNTNTPVNLCLSYHLCGGCYSNYQRSSTHWPLMAPEQCLMTTFIAQYLPPVSNNSTTSSISTTNSLPPGAAPMPAVAPAAGTSNWV